MNYILKLKEGISAYQRRYTSASQHKNTIKCNNTALKETRTAQTVLLTTRADANKFIVKFMDK